jgi:hypothetical protein
VVGVGIGREDETALDYNGAKDRGGVNIDQEVKALGDINHITF